MDKEDYIKILTFYKIQIPKLASEIKQKAEHLMTTQLCKCIKSKQCAATTRGHSKYSKNRTIRHVR
jgi:hypothetical protein